MRVSGRSHQGYKLGEEVQGDYAIQCLIKHYLLSEPVLGHKVPDCVICPNGLECCSF